MNTQALQDVLDSPYSSESDKSTASAALYREANPIRVVTETTEPTVVAAATVAVGDWWSGKGPVARADFYSAKRGEWKCSTVTPEPDNPKWSVANQAIWERLTYPEVWAANDKAQADLKAWSAANEAAKAAKLHPVGVPAEPIPMREATPLLVALTEEAFRTQEMRRVEAQARADREFRDATRDAQARAVALRFSGPNPGPAYGGQGVQ
jgi:hypothetical protein